MAAHSTLACITHFCLFFNKSKLDLIITCLCFLTFNRLKTAQRQWNVFSLCHIQIVGIFNVIISLFTVCTQVKRFLGEEIMIYSELQLAMNTWMNKYLLMLSSVYLRMVAKLKANGVKVANLGLFQSQHKHSVSYRLAPVDELIRTVFEQWNLEKWGR